MLVTLRLRNFRCYPVLRWDAPPEGAILLGDNARGKTSLLEAICFALTLHSPRAARMDKLARHGTADFGISLDTELDTRRLVWEERRLSMMVNGAPRRDYADYLNDAPPVTWLGNKDIALVSGPAEERRRYLDFLGTQWHPAYRESLQAYRKALKSRNALLRNPRHSQATLASYAAVLARHGAVLMQLRHELIRLLMPHVAQQHLRMSGAQEEVNLRYAPSTTLPLEEAFASTLEADERAGCTTLGPHRDELLLSIAGNPAADFASEGQQRTLATALQLAQSSLLQVETGRAPLLLIDDVFGELDPTRRKALLASLPPEAQVFITTTHLDWLGGEASPLPVHNISTIRR